MNIYLIRHGETDWNKAGKMQGSVDIPLNPYGISLAEITSAAMKDIPVDIIYSSPLQRAYRTAQILMGERNISILTDPRLQEMDFGKYEGSSIERAKEYKEEPMYNFFEYPERYLAQDGENFTDVIARARSFLEEVLLPAQGHYENVLVSSHGAWIRCFLRCIEERPISEFWCGNPQKNCAVTQVTLQDGHLEIIEEGRIYYEEGPF